MFGSNFDANFGIPAFPFQSADPQGGLFGTNIDPAQTGGTDVTGQPSQQITQQAPLAVSSQPSSASPLAASPLAGTSSLNSAPQQTTAAPAAGLGSQFGNPQV